MAANDLTKILYVEDDVFIQRIAQIALQKVGGFEVKICNAGQQALAEAPIFKPDLILLDIMLPEMDGLMIQSALKQNPATAEIPVVFMTARVQAEEVEEYCRRGALGVIFKPFDPMTLASKLRELWKNSQI
ncbi:MAG: response regulator [Gammaproteobacteria bacterium]